MTDAPVTIARWIDRHQTVRKVVQCSREEQSDCCHAWRRRPTEDVTGGWESVCKLCGAFSRERRW